MEFHFANDFVPGDDQKKADKTTGAARRERVMRKVIGGAVLGAILVAVVIAVARPQLTESLFPGLWASHHRKVVRERSTELIRCLCRDDMDGCIRLADPVFVRQQGVDKVKLLFKLMNVIATLGKIQETDVRVDDVTLGPENKTAEVPISIQIRGEWKVQKPLKWVRSDGQWYVAF